MAEVNEPTYYLYHNNLAVTHLIVKFLSLSSGGSYFWFWFVLCFIYSTDKNLTRIFLNFSEKMSGTLMFTPLENCSSNEDVNIFFSFLYGLWPHGSHNINAKSHIKYACAEGGAHLPIAHALRLLSTQEWRFVGWRGVPQYFFGAQSHFFVKIVGKPLLKEKYAEGRRKKKKEE